jgi:hypothetical protein
MSRSDVEVRCGHSATGDAAAEPSGPGLRKTLGDEPARDLDSFVDQGRRLSMTFNHAASLLTPAPMVPLDFRLDEGGKAP